MGIRVVVGVDPPARRSALIEMVLAGGPAQTLVARNAAVQHDLGRMLAAGATRGITTLSWQAWVDSLWLSAGDGRSIVDAPTRAALIVEAIGASSDSVGQSALNLGGGRALLAEVVEEVGSQDFVLLDEAYRHLASAVETYRELARQRGFVERAEAIEILAAEAPRLEGMLAFVGFSDLTDRETDLLITLASRGEVIVDLAYSSGAGALAGNAAAMAQFENIGAEVVVARGIKDPPTPSTVVTRIWEGEGEERPGDWHAAGVLTYGLAEGSPAEVCLVADRVEAEIARGTNLDEIGVILRKSKRIAPRIADELERRQIPYVVLETVPFESTGLGAAYLALLNASLVALTDPGAQGAPLLGAFITSSYSGIAHERAVRVDARARRARSSITDLISKVRWSRPADPSAATSHPELTAVGLAERAVDPARAAEVSRALKDVADMIAANGRAQAAATWRTERQDAAAHRAVADTITSLEEAGSPVTVGAVIQALAGSTVIVSPRPNTRGRVTVAAATRVSGRTFASVVLAGLAEDDYAVVAEASASQRVREALGLPPSPDIAESEELLGAEMIAMARERLHLVWRSHDQKGEALAQSGLLRAVLDAAGHPEEVAARDGVGEGAVLRTSLTDPNVIASRSHARAERTGDYRDPRSAAPLAAERGALPVSVPGEYWADRDLSPSQIERYHRCPYAWFLEKFVRAEELDAQFGTRERGTLIHRMLERFYEHWVRELGGGAMTPDDLAQAKAAFDVIADEEIRSATEALNGSASGAAADDADSDADDEYFGGAEDGGEDGGEEDVAIRGSAAHRAITMALVAEDAWARIVADSVNPYGIDAKALAADELVGLGPRYFEWKFGSQARHEAERAGGAADPDLYLNPVEIDGVRLTGSIDRIDIADGLDPETGSPRSVAAIVDYKSTITSYPASKSLIAKGYIQAPIYLLAARAALGVEGAYAGYASCAARSPLVVGVSDGRLERGPGHLLSAGATDEFATMLGEVESLVGDVAGRMRAGHVSPANQGDRKVEPNCKRCHYSACPYRKSSW